MQPPNRRPHTKATRYGSRESNSDAISVIAVTSGMGPGRVKTFFVFQGPQPDAIHVGATI
jgi:hypothetical protein